MAVLKIAIYPEQEKLLRERCKPVTKLTPGIHRLIENMFETMDAASGVGLAAPQVFQPIRLFVYDTGEDDGPDALINPEIVHAEGEETDAEGCLSMPRLEGDVPRAARVVVRGVDRRGRRVRIDAEKLLARVFQHEIDHLNGVLFIDRADRKSLHWITEEEEAERRARRQEEAAKAAARSGGG
jgi:peptide deformylase